MSSSRSDIFSVIVAFLVVCCFGALIFIQVQEHKYYSDPTAPGGNVWPDVVQTAPK